MFSVLWIKAFIISKRPLQKLEVLAEVWKVWLKVAMVRPVVTHFLDVRDTGFQVVRPYLGALP